MDSTTPAFADGDDAVTTTLVLLPGLDGTGKLFTDFLKALDPRVVSKAATARIMRGIPHAQRVEVDGPHLLLQTCPKECAAAVLKSIRGGQTAGPAIAGPAAKQTC